MKFTTLNVYTTEPLRLLIEHDGRSVTMDIKAVLSKVSPANLVSDTIWKPFEDYAAYRGSEYATKLMDRYINLQETLISNMVVGSSDSTYLLTDIVDMINVEDMEKFLINYKLVNAPATLPDEFVSEAGDGKTKIQTYTKKEYFGITALSLCAKMLIGPFGEYATVMSHTLQSNAVEFSLMQIIMSKDNLFNTAPMIKLLGVMTNMTKIAGAKTQSVPMTRLIPSEDIPIWLLSLAFVKRMSIKDITEDDSGKNVITRVYNLVNNTLNENPNVTNTIKDKKPTSDGEEMESMIESYRTATDLAPGTKVEFNWALSDPYFLLDKLGLSEHSKMLDKALKFLNVIRNSNMVPSGTVNIVSWILHDELDCRSFLHVNMDSIVNAIAVSYVYCEVNDMHEIALLLTSIFDKSGEVRLSQSVSKAKVKKDAIEALVNSNYKLSRVAETSINHTVTHPIDATIKIVSDSYFSANLIYTAPNDVLGHVSKHVTVPSNLKPLLATLISVIDR